MTAEKLAKMRAGRARQLAEQAVKDREAVTLFRELLAKERKAYQKYAALRDLLGWDHEFVKEAKDEWRFFVASFPSSYPTSEAAWQ